jgi:hypothetical protein
VITNANFGTLPANMHVIIMGNGIKSGNGYLQEQGSLVGANCTASGACLAWKTGTPSKSGARVDQYNCYVFRAATQVCIVASGCRRR